MMRAPSRSAAVAVMLLAAFGLGTPAEAAAAAPPPVSDLRVWHVYDHTIQVTFSVPAAYYDKGAGGVAALTRGRTPAAKPSSGSELPVVGHTVTTSRTLRSNTAYTISVWVHDHERYSSRRSITVTTKRDTTPPAGVTALTAQPTLSPSLVPGMWLRWRASPNTAGDLTVRIVRTTTSWAGGKVLRTAGGDGDFIDTDPSLRRNTTYHYYVAEHDAAGNYAPYVRVDVTTNLRRIALESNGSLASYDAAGHAADTLPETQEADPSYPDVAGKIVNDQGRAGINVVPGAYTVCAIAPPPDPPDAHMQLTSGCWAPDPSNPTGGTVDGWNGDTTEFPPSSVGAVDVSRGDRRDLEIDLSYS